MIHLYVGGLHVMAYATVVDVTMIIVVVTILLRRKVLFTRDVEGRKTKSSIGRANDINSAATTV